MPLASAILKQRRAQPFVARQPWVYAGLIDKIEGAPADGDEIQLLSSSSLFIARGLYNSQSKISIRLFSWEDRPLDRDFFRDRLARAIALRELLGLRGAERGCRLVCSEGDSLPGLTVDEYAGWLTVQFTSLALANRREMFADILVELLSPKGIYIRTEKGIGKLEGLTLTDGVLRGETPPSEVVLVENGVSFYVNLAEGQKTGFYHDQRDNRQAVARFAKGKRMLDLFSYTGGFGLHAAKAGASSVECVDVSAPALALGMRNAERNGLLQMTFTKSDVFRFLERAVEAGRKCDLIVLDPPKFARSRDTIPEALNGYRQLFRLSTQILERGGFLVVCCCSGLITPDMLTEALGQLAGDEKRDVQIIERHGPAPDHPFSASCPESAYLKCFICRVS